MTRYLTTHDAGSACRRQRGFTLVELMVAVAVGLVLTLAITGTVLTMGKQFRVTGANVTAQGGAQIALALIDSAGRAAGAGLFSNGQLLCPSLNAWKDGDTKLSGAVFLPARIEDGGADSDTIVFSASNAAGSLAALPLMAGMAAPEANVVVGAGVIQNGELALIGAPGSNQPCTLIKLTGAPTTPPAIDCAGNATACQTLPRVPDDTTGYNPTNAVTAFGLNARRYGFGADWVGPVFGPAVVSRMGTEFRQQAFGVRCTALVQYNAFPEVPAGACGVSPLSFPAGFNALAMDVVLMHAQYGVSAAANTDEVISWVNATGGWVAPSAANGALIKAVRVVIVVRSKEPGTGTVTVACTNGAGVVNTGPCSFNDAQAPVINLSAVPVPAGRTWQNYSYRVHQAVVPLRNIIWNN